MAPTSDCRPATRVGSGGPIEGHLDVGQRVSKSTASRRRRGTSSCLVRRARRLGRVCPRSIALKTEEVEATAAEERKGGRPARGKPVQLFAPVSGKARDLAADAWQVNHAHVSDAKWIGKQGARGLYFPLHGIPVLLLAMTPIKTASWFARIPDANHVRVSISRGSSRGVGGYKIYKPLMPGAWFSSVSPAEYLARYQEIMAALNPAVVVSEIEELTAGRVATLTCFESAAQVADGTSWCHRHLVKLWLEYHLDIEITEVGAPADFDPFIFWKKSRILLPFAR